MYIILYILYYTIDVVRLLKSDLSHVYILLYSWCKIVHLQVMDQELRCASTEKYLCMPGNSSSTSPSQLSGTWDPKLHEM